MVALLWLLLAADPLAQVFERAASALSSGDYAAAEAGFQQVLKASPKHIGAMGNLGVVYSRMGRFDRAVQVYRRALALSPSDKGLLLNLGLAFIKQESYAEARHVFEGLVKAAPMHPQARGLLATCQLHTGQIDAAVAAFESLVKENTGLLYLLGIGYLKQGRPEQAGQAFDAFLATAPPALANFTLCKAYYESELFDDAAAYCRKALEIDPKQAGVHREFGKVLVSLRSPDAVKELTVATRENPNDAEAIYFLGAELLQEDRQKEALPHLERARQLNPGFWGAYFYLGKAKAQAGQNAAAIPLLQQAAELNGSESAIFYQLGRALSSVGRTEESKRAMDRVRELKALSLDRETKAFQTK